MTQKIIFGTLLTILGFALLSETAIAQVVSPSSEEVKFSFVADFITADTESDEGYKAQEHLQHLFGIMHSPSLTKSFRINPSKIEGFGAIRLPADIRILKSEINEEGLRVISYRVAGVMLLHRLASTKILSKGEITLPLPYEIDHFYAKHCTDDHYDSLGDFWYFYDPFREGCESFRKAPLAKEVIIAVKPTKVVQAEVSPRLDLVRADNQNGDVFLISMINGFADSNRDPEDVGRKNFEEFNEMLKAKGFKESKLRSYFPSPMFLYEKDFTLENGKIVKVKIQRLLVNSDSTSRSDVFADYFRKAVEKADVLIYNGHSGLGGNLDIDYLEARAGNFRIDQKKKQIFFFDSCASYSYYLNQFSAQKRKSKIDIMTNGLSSYFHTANQQHQVLLEALLDFKSNPNWMQILNKMERSLKGSSYLLNVGGI